MRPLAALFCFTVVALAQTWTDHAEYDLVFGLRSEALPRKRLVLLDEWKQKYPKSPMRQERRELYLAAYQSLGDGGKMLSTALEMLTEDPNNFVGQYWTTVLLPEARQATPAILAEGEQAARRLANGLGTRFAAANKPAGVTAEAWTGQRQEVEILAHRAMGWAAWQRGDLAAAESEFTTCLKADPKRAEVSGWYGLSLASQREEPKQQAALWHIARAASLQKVPGSLSDGERRQMEELLERVYGHYHGSVEGLTELRAKVTEQPFPPEGFKIETAAVIAARKAKEEFERANPELAAWMKIRERLSAADGEAYFAESLKGTVLTMLKGTVLKGEPARKPSRFALALSAPVAGAPSEEEMMLKLGTPERPASLSVAVPEGTVFLFRATADGFTRMPFQLVVHADPQDVQVLPPVADSGSAQPPKQ